ncbi:YitT family protein [Nocardioides sp. Kera G14]|uniref:YitT family protein n=1 Tax=Nocardioides sp. Kera G14 TaxID=2884264 RepID=UPI001D123626|nr:YitT family protein [Nocardioides sp. Kera G14]UDY23650.1 YitT family protein [Nocardioides sp. Kera G14]
MAMDEGVDLRAEPPPHGVLEDLLGLAIGIFLTSLGLYLIHVTGAVTGGTAGLSLLISYAANWNFQLVFALINLPFVVVAFLQKGADFAIRSALSVVAVSLATGWQGDVLGLDHLDRSYGVLAGAILTGMGVLALVRHNSSIGGFSVVAVILQEKAGMRAGYVMMSLDALVLLASFLVLEPGVVLWSALGAALLNIVLAFNHRPGRYMGL